jgi:replicative DNA helicase
MSDYHAEDAKVEAAVARAAVCSGEGMERVLEHDVGDELFTHPGLRALFAEAFALHVARRTIDPVVLTATLSDPAYTLTHRLKDDELSCTLRLLETATPDRAASFNPEWVAILKARARKRKLIAYLRAATLTAESTPESDIDGVIDEAGRKALALADERADSTVLTDPLDHFERWAARPHTGPATGFPWFDKPPSMAGLGGLVPGQMTVGTAPTNEGKSALGISIVANLIQMMHHADTWLERDEHGDEYHTPYTRYLASRAANLDQPTRLQMETQSKTRILFFSTEMNGGHLSAKVVQALARSTMTEVRNKGLGDPIRHDMIMDWFRYLKKKLLIYDEYAVGAQISSIIASQAPRWEDEGYTTVVVIDHLHRMQGLNKQGDSAASKGNLNIFYKDLTEMLHTLARRYHVSILAFAQMGNDKVGEFRSSNDVESLTFKEGGDMSNIVDNTFVFGKSNERELASIGWVKKVRHLEDASIFEMPFYLRAFPLYSRLEEITKDVYDTLPERTV